MEPKRINLALQGGGAHGAFTWGVLDRLLEDEAIEIAGISGTSAGALNGAALKSGMLENGRAGARANLDWLWRQMGAIHDFRLSGWMTTLMPSAGQVNQWLDAAAPFSPLDVATQMFSPYALGPAWVNPLERVVRRFRFDRVCAMEGPALFVSATNVRTGKVRVFRGGEITTDAILASACLPTLFKAVEIADPETGRVDAYWDGGYTGNPALFPLYDAALPDDIVIVNINPLCRDEVPTTPQDIQNRINEISFNSSLLRELRGLAMFKELLAKEQVTPGAMPDANIHMIADDELMNTLSAGSKLTPTPFLLHELKMSGRAAADRFLGAHRDDLGECSTVDLATMLA